MGSRLSVRKKCNIGLLVRQRKVDWRALHTARVHPNFTGVRIPEECPLRYETDCIEGSFLSVQAYVEHMAIVHGPDLYLQDSYLKCELCQYGS